MVWFSYHASTKAWIIKINVLHHWNSIICMIHFALWNLSIGISCAQKRMSINLRFFAKCVYMVPSRVETTTAQTWNFMNLLFLQHVFGMVPSRDGTIFRKFEGRGHATDPGLLSCNAQYIFLALARRADVLFIKFSLPMKKKLPASQQTAQPAACTISCTASCVWWNCFVNFHRLRIIIPGAPLTCNTPAAAPPETKKTTLANSVIIKHDIIALGSRFFETKNVSEVFPWLNFF